MGICLSDWTHRRCANYVPPTTYSEKMLNQTEDWKVIAINAARLWPAPFAPKAVGGDAVGGESPAVSWALHRWRTKVQGFCFHVANWNKFPPCSLGVPEAGTRGTTSDTRVCSALDCLPPWDWCGIHGWTQMRTLELRYLESTQLCLCASFFWNGEKSRLLLIRKDIQKIRWADYDLISGCYW